MTRPIHDSIIQICSAVEQQGAMTITGVRLAMPAADAESVRRHCNRAIGLRLLVIDRKACPFEYRVRAGWRETLAGKTPMPTARRVSSVWDLGVLA